jgi:Uri superfamily endonuclease
VISIPPESGSYLLELSISNPLHLQVGRLGDFFFPSGSYIYVGSALGPGGLRARLSRYLDASATAAAHWHIDYLLPHAELVAACFLVHDPRPPQADRMECLWSEHLLRLPSSFVPAPGFGASDCRSTCSAHLVGFHPTAKGAILSDPILRQELARFASLPGESLEFHFLSPEVRLDKPLRVRLSS